MSGLRVVAPRTFADENVLQQDRITTKQIVASTRRGLGVAAPVNKPTASPSSSSEPIKPTSKLTAAVASSTPRRVLGDITNAKKQPQLNPTNASSKPTLKKPTPVAAAAVPTSAAPLAQPESPPPIERSLGATWREQEERAMAELATRRDSLTGLTPAELAASVTRLLQHTNTRRAQARSEEEEREVAGWATGLDEVSGSGGEVDERKMQALLDLDLDIDLDL